MRLLAATFSVLLLGAPGCSRQKAQSQAQAAAASKATTISMAPNANKPNSASPFELASEVVEIGLPA